jgi:hypothetical protein
VVAVVVVAVVVGIFLFDGVVLAGVAVVGKVGDLREK